MKSKTVTVLKQMRFPNRLFLGAYASPRVSRGVPAAESTKRGVDAAGS